MTSRRGVAVVGVGVAALAVWLLWTRHPNHEATPARGSAAGQHASGPLSRVDALAAGRRIAGVVTLDGKPVEGATLRLIGLFAEQTTLSDAGGRFAFARVPVGDYVLAAEREHTTGATLAVDLRTRSDAEDLALVLHDCNATLEGFVRDASGGPVAHARVTESADGIRSGTGTESADDGHYELCVSPEEVQVMVRADGYAQMCVPLLSTGHVHHDFALVPEAVIAGRVVRTGDHAAVVGADVVAEPESYESMFGIGRLHAITDDTGRFHTTGARPARYLLTATAPGLATAAPTPLIAEVAAPTDVTIELAATATVRGVVREAGAPVANARVVLRPSHSFPMAGEYAMTQPDGTFAIENVLPGDYSVLVDDFSLPRPATIEVTHKDITGLAVDVESLPSIEGRVTYQGSPVDGASVNGGAGPVITDASGHFLLRGLSEGAVHVYAESKRLGAFTPGPEITLAGHQHKTGIEVPLDLVGSIAGSVVDQDGAPVGGVVVSFSLLHGHDYGTATTAADGTFKATALSGGGSYLYEVRAGAQSATVFHSPDGKRFPPIAVRDGATRVTDLRIRIHYDRLAISGHVVASGGEPLADVVVEAAPTPYTGGGITALTDAAGAFSMRSLQAGTYDVIARCSRGQVTTKVAAGRSDVTLTIPAAATIVGTLEDFSEVPAISLLGLDDTYLPYRPRIAGSRFEFQDVSPGKYRITAASPNGDADDVVTVKAGEHTSVTLHRRGFGTIAGTVVTADGAPVAGAHCVANEAGSVATTDSSGAFRIEKLHAGRGWAVCRLGKGSRAEADVTVVSDQVASVKLVLAATEPPHKPDIGLTTELQFFDEQIVTAVVAGSPADKAGLQTGDIIVDVDGDDASGFYSFLVATIENHPPGTIVKLTIERGDKRQTIELTVPSPSP